MVRRISGPLRQPAEVDHSNSFFGGASQASQGGSTQHLSFSNGHENVTYTIEKTKFKIKKKYFSQIENLPEILQAQNDESQSTIYLPLGISKELFRKFVEFSLNHDNAQSQTFLLKSMLSDPNLNDDS